mgnify:CR=1 FL=1
MRILHIELTTFCNLSCAFCPKKVDVRYHLDYDSLLKNVLLSNYISEVTDIYLVGSLGDCSLYPDLLKFLNYVLTHTKAYISIGSNGSTHDTSWWFTLGSILKDRGEVEFALDGLEDTHYLYRKSDYARVLANMQEFISGGGRAVWKYVVFEHNVHQVEEAFRKSVSLGCFQFKPFESHGYSDTLEKPKEDKISQEVPDTILFNSFECQFLNKSFFIGADGLVSPCCRMFSVNKSPICWNFFPTTLKINFLKNKKYLDIYTNSMDNIITNPFFECVLENMANLKSCREWCSHYPHE